MVTGDVFVVPIDAADPIDRARQASAAAENAHWRCSDITAVPVDEAELRA